jgi:hypothetical protein
MRSTCLRVSLELPQRISFRTQEGLGRLWCVVLVLWLFANIQVSIKPHIIENAMIITIETKHIKGKLASW